MLATIKIIYFSPGVRPYTVRTQHTWCPLPSPFPQPASLPGRALAVLTALWLSSACLVSRADLQGNGKRREKENVCLLAPPSFHQHLLCFFSFSPLLKSTKTHFKRCKEGPHVVHESSKPSPLHRNPMPTRATLSLSLFKSKDEAEDSECLPSMHGALGL